MQDGVAENFTAGMIEDYLDGCGHQTGNRGLSYVDPQELREHVTRLDAERFGVHFHAIGDRAVREALDAVAAARDANGPTPGRHHIAHLQVVHGDDIPRFRELGVTANMQALWAAHEPQMDELTIPFLGAERAMRQYPFGDLLRSGAMLAAGSDWAVSSANPLWGIHTAVTRTLPPGAGEPAARAAAARPGAQPRRRAGRLHGRVGVCEQPGPDGGHRAGQARGPDRGRPRPVRRAGRADRRHHGAAHLRRWGTRVRGRLRVGPTRRNVVIMERMTLDRIPLGRGGPQVSRAGLGLMGMSGIYGQADDAESVATIRSALDAGITLLDTGDFYGMGHNEMLLRDALRGVPRDSVFIQVKFGAQRDPGGAFVGYDASPAAVKTSLAYSLRRLGTDYVDLYQPARLDPGVPIEETVGAIAEMIDAGYVRYVGLSEAGAQTIRRAHATHPITALQIEYSLMSRGIEGRDPAHRARARHRRDGLWHPVPRPAEHRHGPAARRTTRGAASPGSTTGTWSVTSACSGRSRRSRSSGGRPPRSWPSRGSCPGAVTSSR